MIKGTAQELLDEMASSLGHWMEMGRNEFYAAGMEDRFGIPVDMIQDLVSLREVHKDEIKRITARLDKKRRDNGH